MKDSEYFATRLALRTLDAQDIHNISQDKVKAKRLAGMLKKLREYRDAEIML